VRRVALCFGTYPPERNGGSDFVARLAAALADAGSEVHVLTSAAPAAADGERAGVVVHRAIDDWGLGRQARRRAAQLLRETGVEVVHVLFPDSVLQERFLLPAALGLGRVPLVATWWNLGLGRRSPAPVKFESLALLARTRVLTSHDPSYLRALRLGLGWARPTAWLPVGNNLSLDGTSLSRAEARSLLALEPDARWLGYFGQLDPTRGVEDLFGAVASLRRSRDVRVVMIGSAGRAERYRLEEASAAYLDAMLRLPHELGIGDAVVWTEYLPDRDVGRYFRALDLCVLPYRRNSLGRSSLATALELGVPTVLAGTERGIAPLRAGSHVALAPPSDPRALAAAVERVLSDDGESERLAAGARRAAALFAWPRIAVSASTIYARAARATLSPT
jgi:glycosyltransferase involved in cell wall biosynthesis